jgi:hypothetical protein
MPTALRAAALNQYHDSATSGGHQGARKTLRKLRRRLFWPTMVADTQNYVRSCHACAARKPAPRYRAGLRHTTATGTPWRRVHLDLWGPTTPSDGFKYVMVVRCGFLRYVELVPLRNQEALTIARALFDEVISRHGAFSELTTDQGPNLTAQVVRRLLSLFNIRCRTTAPYHPQANASAESMMRPLAHMLTAYCSATQSNWSRYIKHVQLIYNTAPLDEFGVTPFFLVYGRDAVLPADQLFTVDDADLSDVDLSDYVEATPRVLQAAHRMLAAQQSARHAAAAASADAHEHRFDVTFEEGQRVWIYRKPQSDASKSLSAKLMPRWSGPFYVVAAHGRNTYLLRDANTGQEWTENVQHIREYHERPADLQHTAPDAGASAAADSTVDDNDDPVYLVEAILDHKRQGRRTLFLVKWVGYDQTTWEPEAHMLGATAKRLLAAYKIDNPDWHVPASRRNRRRRH